MPGLWCADAGYNAGERAPPSVSLRYIHDGSGDQHSDLVFDLSIKQLRMLADDLDAIVDFLDRRGEP